MIMAKHTNVVRFRVKPGKQKEFENIFNESDILDGQLLHVLAKTGDQSYVAFALWKSEQMMIDARPKMINLLDSGRHLLEELSPELGVTDPVAGAVVFQKKID